MAGESIQADQDALTRDLYLCGILDEHSEHAQKFAAGIASTSAPKGSQKLMDRGLKRDGSGAHHISACASLVTFGADLSNAMVRNWERLCLGKATLSSHLPGAIHISN